MGYDIVGEGEIVVGSDDEIVVGRTGNLEAAKCVGAAYKAYLSEGCTPDEARQKICQLAATLAGLE